MKKTNYLFIVLFSLIASSQLMAQEPRKLTEATISYDIVININNSKPQAADLLDGATSILYLKGNSSRSEMISSLGTQATIIDGKTGEVVILKNYGEQKYLITLTPENWKQSNKKYDGIKFTYYEEYKTIIGYKCQKAIGKLTDSTSFTVYFTKDLVPENKDFEYINKNLPGLALQYEAIQGKRTVTYTVSNINFINPVPQSKFDIPVSGYRKMTYEESKRGSN
jgi:GLPGLI family protein